MRQTISLEDRTRAIQRGTRDALREHALLGRSVVVRRDGKVVELSPAEIFEELRRTDPDADPAPSVR